MEDGTEGKTYAVTDLFCGAGGSSEGAKKAIEETGGRMKLWAVNHWQRAIETHSANHPDALHLVEDVNLVDPESVVEDGYLDILMASPECKFFSRARGGKPIHDQGRMHPWTIFNWLDKLDVRCVLVENVPEFVRWGPLLVPEGVPDKTRSGESFQAWLMTFWNLGYHAEWRMLNAADYGDATTRIRFFLMARKDGKPIVWPEPTHARVDTPMLGGLSPWRGAREIIDWSNPGRSLLDDPKYIKKPLSEKTRQRIARGLQRFGGALAPLYIRLLGLPGEETDVADAVLAAGQPFLLNRNGENGSDRIHSQDDPMPTATGRGAGYLVDAAQQPFHGSDRQNTIPRSMDEPVHTITTLTGGGEYVVRPLARPFVAANRQNNAPKGIDEPIPAITTAHGGGSFIVETDLCSFVLGQQSGSTPRGTDEPVPTVASDGAISLVRPAIIEYYGNSGAREVELPLPAITRCNKHGLAHPTLVQLNHGNGPQGERGNNRRVQSVEEPLPAITTSPGLALANPALIQVNHGDGSGVHDAPAHRTHSAESPLPSPTTRRNLGLALPILMQTGQTGGNGCYARPVTQPLPTLTTKNDMGLVTPGAEPIQAAAPFTVPNFGERAGQEPRVHDVREPVTSVTSRGAGSLVCPLMDEILQEKLRQEEIDPRRVVFVDGVPYLLDIRFRMLQNIELARAMGFSDEESQYEFVGNVTEVTKQIGNAVAVNLAAALVRAVLGRARPDKLEAELTEGE